MSRQIIRLVIATGVASVATQLAVIREFLCLFAGNEFVIAVTLFNWLLLGGCGTLCFRVIRELKRPSLEGLASLSLLLCLVGGVQIPVFRMVYKTLFIPGQAVGFYPTLVFTFLASAPYCLLVGYLLPLSLDLAAGQRVSRASTEIYMADSLGDTLGGALFSFALVWLLTPVQAVVAASMPLILLVFMIQKTRSARVVLVLTMGILLICLNQELGTLEKAGIEPVFYKETPYARVTVHEGNGSRTLFQNHIPRFDTQNTEAAEKIIHYPLSQVDAPSDVLLISAVSGVFKELDKYPLKRIDYVEIDPEVAGALTRFGFCKPGPQVRSIHRDARLWLSDTDQQYDAVILTLSDPDTYQVNRFFTREFFVGVKQHLRRNGVFSFSITGYSSYPSDALVEKASSLNATLEGLFERVLILPGRDLTFLVKKQGDLILDIPELLEKRGIHTIHIKNYFHGDITSERVAQLKSFIKTPGVPNLDFSPELIRISFFEWFSRFDTSPKVFGIAVGILLVIWLGVMNRAASVLFFTGFFTMGAEMMVVFAFQIYFGYIYVKVGMIITLFLAGLLPGAYLGEKSSLSSAEHRLVMADICLVVILSGFIALLAIFPRVVSEAAFLGLAFGFGFLCGFQFPCAAKIRQEKISGITGLFAADLAGAAFGILIFSLLLVPALGLIQAGMVLVAVKCAGMMRFKLWNI